MKNKFLENYIDNIKNKIDNFEHKKILNIIEEIKKIKNQKRRLLFTAMEEVPQQQVILVLI